jgi:Transposase DDE domain
MAGSLSHRQALVQGIQSWFPSHFFARWSLRAGLLWKPQRLLWMLLFLAFSAEQTLTERFQAALELLQSLFPRWRLGRTYTGFTEAAARFAEPLLPAVARHLRQQLQAGAGRHWTRQGWCAFAADGSRVECPRTAANEDTLGCAGKERTAPQLYLTTLWHMGTGLLWDYRTGPGTASERRHLEAMLPDLPADALVVADAGFTGYEFYQRFQEGGHAFLLRVGANVQLLQQLGYAIREGPDTVYLWPEKHSQQPPLVLRLIVVPTAKQPIYLLTNVLDADALPATSAAVLYQMRWGVEVFYRSCKQTLARRKMLSQAPVQAELELKGVVLGLWLLGLMSVSALIGTGRDPLSWSVAQARRQIRQLMRQACATSRCRQSLVERLAGAQKDSYERQGSKRARNWPHKKREKPPGEPKIRLATAAEVRKATRLRSKEEAA